MTFDPERHRRRSLRAKWHDYASAGRYFVTICTANRECLFGDVVDGVVWLNAFGQIVERQWRETPTIRPYVNLDEFVVMPNHLHGIITITPHDVITGNRVADTAARGTTPGSLGAIVQQFKGVTTKHINAHRSVSGIPVWQRNYEHVIQHPDDLDRIRSYIISNPSRWLDDEHHPDSQSQFTPIQAM